jgi:predicted PurR-regulated permease PerM
MDERKLRGATLLLLAIIISALFFRMIQSFVLALLLAAIFAALGHPTYLRVLRVVKGRKGLASVATLLLAVLLVFTPLMMLMTVVANEAAQVSATVGPWVQQLLSHSGDWEQRLERIPWVAQLAPYQADIMAKAGELGGKAAHFAVNSLATGTQGTARFFLLLFVMVYALFFFLQDGQAILDRTLRCVPLPVDDKRRMLETFTSVTRASLKGTLVIGIVQGVLAGAAFAVIGIPGPVFWGAVMAVMSVIPGVGTAVVWVPAVVWLAVESRTGAAIGLAVWCSAVVGTADNFLRPLLVGKDTKMPDLLILLGTMGGLVLFGAVGLVIGPIIAALFVTVWELYGSAVDEIRDAPQPPSTGAVR